MIEETLIRKIVDISGVGITLGVIITLYLIYKIQNDIAKKYIKSMKTQIKKYYNCDYNSIDVSWEFRDSRLEWRDITFLRDGKPFKSEILINFGTLEILKYNAAEEM